MNIDEKLRLKKDKNCDKRRAQNRKYYQNNRDKAREYYDKNAEEIFLKQKAKRLGVSVSFLMGGK